MPTREDLEILEAETREILGAAGEEDEFDPFVDEQEYEEDSMYDEPFMSTEEMQSIIKRDISDAIQWYESEHESDHEIAVEYYDGDLPEDGDPGEGRSHYVETIVRDTIRGIMPDLLRVFFGSEKVVEYNPATQQEVPEAQARTDYVNRVVMQEDNPGFMVAYEAFHDALLKGIGAIKWGWDSGRSTSAVYDLHGVPAEQWAMILQEDPNLEVVSQQIHEDGTVSGAIRKIDETGRAMIWAVPPSELLYDPRGRSKRDSRMIGHRTSKTVSELIAMGIEWVDIEDHVGSGEDMEQMSPAEVKELQNLLGHPDLAPEDVANAKVEFVELYRYLDMDHDGNAELRKFICLGGDHEVVSQSEWDEIPFALFGAIPKPHTFHGWSVTDLVKDLQRVVSKVTRAMLDNLAQHVHPREVVVDGQVNVDDVQSTELGRVVREYSQGAYRTIEMPFSGGDVLPVRQMFEQVREERTGQTRATKGLSPDVLQSSTEAAVNATMLGSQKQIEMIARIFAETGWKDLMAGLQRLLAKHQDFERMVRLRDTFIPIDPRAWDSELDVKVNVALGAGLPEQRAAVLQLLAQKQEALIAQMGPVNPVVSLHQYSNTLAKIAELSGIHDVSRYISEVDPAWQPPPPPPPEPDPNLILAQAEMFKAKSKDQVDRIKARLDWQEKLLDDNRERDRLEIDALLRAAEVRVKEGSVNEGVLRRIAQSAGVDQLGDDDA